MHHLLDNLIVAFGCSIYPWQRCTNFQLVIVFPPITILISMNVLIQISNRWEYSMYSIASVLSLPHYLTCQLTAVPATSTAARWEKKKDCNMFKHIWPRMCQEGSFHYLNYLWDIWLKAMKRFYSFIREERIPFVIFIYLFGLKADGEHIRFSQGQSMDQERAWRKRQYDEMGEGRMIEGSDGNKWLMRDSTARWG